MDIAQRLFYAQQSLAALFATVNRLQVRGDQYLGDITLRQMLAIPAILHAPDQRASINHIARRLGTTKQSARQIVDAMARKGYVSVAPSDADRRAVDVTVTPEGTRAFALCAKRTDLFLADVFGTFSAQELKTLCDLLERVRRFDGAGAEDGAHAHFDAQAAQEILEHHPDFVARTEENRRERE